ncbi:unnamed protein product [Ambrosiozyma monospora]|nr:unnamed protein product [Ambrosiozyma monospora]
MMNTVFTRRGSRASGGAGGGIGDYSNLRPYNLGNGSRSSFESGYSLNTRNNSFESDNRLIRDDELMYLDDDDDDAEERIVI